MANKKVLHGEVDGATVVGVSVIGAMMRYASPVDYLYIVCAILSATLSALGWPAFTIINGKVIDAFVRFEMKAANQTNQTATDTAAADDDELVVSRLMSQVYLYSGTQLAVAIVYMIANYGTLYCLQMFALRQVNAIKRHYLHSILTQEIAWFETQTSGQFASQIASDFKKIENGINENFGLLITNAAAAVVQLAAGLWFGWKLSLVILALVPVIYVCTFIANKFQSRYMAREIEANSEASSVAEEAISAIRTVFAFGGQSKEKQRYERALRPAMVNGCKQALVSALDNGIKWCTQYASLALGVWYGVKLILDGEEGYTIGRVVIVFWCITGFGYNLIFATPYWEAFQAARTAAAEIFKIIERKSTIDCSSKSGKRLGVNYQTEIELRNVHFNYPSRPEVTVLDGVDIKINSGEVVALVGASGCGKSTIVQLIQRFYDPIDGEIRLDGTNIKELNVGWLREQIGVVGQEPVLFDASIEENIRLGTSTLRMDSLTREEIVQAAKQANAHEFIQNLPNGYHTYVGDRGTQLSGGQKQRIAIARALVAKPKLLLLDEATSALDLQSEQLVQVALDQASKGRTTIIVAHRLSTIKNADRIIVLDGGKVLESGTHNELMQRHSAYYSLVMAQQVIANDNNDTVNIVNLVNEQTEANKPKAVDDSHEDVEFKKSSAPHRLLQMIWRLNRVQFMVAFLAAILNGLATPTYALIFGSLVDTFGKSTDQDYLWSQTIKFVILFACLSVAIFIFNVLQIYLFGVIKSKLTLKLRVQAFESILGYDVSWFDKARNSSGALSSRLANDAADLQGLTGLRIAMLCQAISTLVSSVCIGFFFSWRMSLVALVLMPIVGVASIYASQLFSGQVRQDGETAEITGKVLIEVTNSIRTVTSLHKQTYFHNMFVSALRKHFKAVQSHVFRKAFFISISQGMTFVAYAVCYCFGGFLLSKGHLTTGDLFRITESMVFGALVVGRTAIFSSDYTKAKLAAFNIFKLIDGKPNRKVITTERSIGRQMRCQGNVSLSDIHFHYPTRPDSTVLNGLSFSARQGETVALVGTSGCGKSTTVQLLQQFYQCQQGQINIDGRNIVHLNVDFVRTQIALVSQEPTLFSQSIKENIAYGDNSRAVPLEDIVKAAQAANVHNFVSELPQGYDTPVGTKGNELSCGQKQRIAIARALVRDPPILLLDEATSSLDMASEKVVQEALDEAAKGRTCIVIAHRLNTIVNADKIVVIHNGQNVEEGTHTELLTHRGHYWQLYNSALTTLQTET